jgi:dienelactone hydrolase
MGDRDLAPYPNDIWFLGPENPDGTLNIPQPIQQGANRNLVLVNTLDGFSTTASIRIPFTGEIDFSSLEPLNPLAPSSTANIIVLDADADTLLIPGVDYTIKLSGAAGADGQCLMIVPLLPLKPKNTYMFFVMAGITDTTGTQIQPYEDFLQIRDAALSQTDIGDEYLDKLASQVLRPVLDKAINLLGLPPERIEAAWSLTTQSVTDVIETVANSAQAQPASLIYSGLSTEDLIESLPGIADIYVGVTDTPYYQSRLDPYGSTWLTAQGALPNRFDSTAVASEVLTIPLLVTIPNADSNQAKPDAGWPVVIFLHGISGNRTQAIAVADSLASIGFAVVSIDHTLHGITDPNNPFYQGPGNPSPLNVFGDNERHFYLDSFSNATGTPGSDGVIDNGIQVLGAMIRNPLNGRDTLRQTTADLIHLVKTIPTLDLNADQVPDLDGSRLHFIGVSWGAIQAPLFLGIENQVTTATLSSPGGAWSDLLTDPQSLTFGKQLLNQLAGLGVEFGSSDFDHWLRDWQNILDPVDSLNYAITSASAHPLHIIEVLGETVIPNAPTERFATVSGSVDISQTTTAQPGQVLNSIVRFSSGDHTSLVSPMITPTVSAEMQNQAAIFITSGGARIDIDTTCNCIQ